MTAQARFSPKKYSMFVRYVEPLYIWKPAD